MSFLLDTNALSETARPAPDATFVRWLDGQAARDLYLSALSLGEIRYGVERLAPGRRRRDLEAWLAELQSAFAEHVLPVDGRVADRWGRVWLAHERGGLSPGVIDELIAATALVHDLTVVTRNVRHFEASGCRVLSPWSAPQ